MKATCVQRHRLAMFGLGCALAAAFGLTANAQRVPIATNQLSFLDFDLTAPSWTPYGYWYSGPTEVTPGGGYYPNAAYTDAGIDPANGPIVFRFEFDSTVYNGTEAATTGWWGTGFGMPMPGPGDPYMFESMDPADYILSFDARVEGLNAGQATGNCTMEFRLGTGGGSGWVMVKSLPYQPGSNWTHYTFTLDQGNWIGADQVNPTSLELFTNAVNSGLITVVQFNQNQPNPSQFGFDADNAILMDNIKLEILKYEGPPPPPPPKVALPVFDYNFDDKNTWWAWPVLPDTTSGWSANANRATFWAVRPDSGAGVNNSDAFAIAMDNTTILTDPPGRPAWAGGNASTGGAVDYSLLTSADLKDYQYNIAARVEGLADFQETSSVVIQLIINAPDDTLQPADSDTGRDLLLRLNLNVSNIRSNWQTFVLPLKDATVDAGSLANFQAHYAKVDEIQFQLQIQNPHQDTVWGLDANNKIVIDDFKLERLFTATPPLQVNRVDNNVVVTWEQPSTGSVKLLTGSTPYGVTNEVAGATSPYNSPVSAAPKYFRTIWVPPAQ